jgi:hypothetical protein
LNIMYTDTKILYDLYNNIKCCNVSLIVQLCSSFSIVNQGHLTTSPCLS